MFNAIRTTLTGLVLFGLLGSAGTADAQMWKKVKKRAKKAAEREVLNEVDRKVTNTVRCTLGDQSCIEQATNEGKEVEVVDESGNVVAGGETSGAAGGAGAAMKPGEGAWANYDFVPGERVLFAEDFSNDNVGDFPRRLEFADGNIEVVEWQGQRLLRINDKGTFLLPLPETLPGRFTIEFNFHNPNRHTTLYLGTSDIDEQLDSGRYPYHRIVVTPEVHGVGISAGPDDKPKSAQANRDYMEQIHPIRIMVDDQYAKMYVGEKRVANLPNAEFNRGEVLRFVYGGFGGPAYIGNIRIAAGGADLYNKLESEGRVATQGIYFDTGSDRIRPESTPTLKEIGSMLKEHSDLRLAIEGHTDNLGEDAVNQTLSEQRAAAVRQHLVSEYGIDASRLEAKGMGESNPVTDNNTAEGRQQNRRVELVKM